MVTGPVLPSLVLRSSVLVGNECANIHEQLWTVNSERWSQ